MLLSHNSLFDWILCGVVTGGTGLAYTLSSNSQRSRVPIKSLQTNLHGLIEDAHSVAKLCSGLMVDAVQLSAAHTRSCSVPLKQRLWSIAFLGPQITRGGFQQATLVSPALFHELGDLHFATGFTFNIYGTVNATGRVSYNAVHNHHSLILHESGEHDNILLPRDQCHTCFSERRLEGDHECYALRFPEGFGQRIYAPITIFTAANDVRPRGSEQLLVYVHAGVEATRASLRPVTYQLLIQPYQTVVYDHAHPLWQLGEIEVEARAPKYSAFWKTAKMDSSASLLLDLHIHTHRVAEAGVLVWFHSPEHIRLAGESMVHLANYRTFEQASFNSSTVQSDPMPDCISSNRGVELVEDIDRQEIPYVDRDDKLICYKPWPRPLRNLQSITIMCVFQIPHFIKESLAEHCALMVWYASHEDDV